MKTLKQWLPLILAVAVLAIGAVAGPIKTWSAGDIITSGDLNANFAHIHGTMVGGHGARLVNSDVAANANIALSKINGSGLLPRARASINATTCTVNGACIVSTSVNVSSITRIALGQYTVLWSTITCAAADCTITVNPNSSAYKVIVTKSSTTADLQFFNAAGVAVDSGFDLVAFK